MLIDKNLLNRHIFYLMFLPSLISCIVIMSVAVYFYQNTKDQALTQQLGFISALYSNQDISDKGFFDTSFNSLLNTQEFYSVAILDKNHKPKIWKGVDISDIYIPTHTKQWQQNKKHFFLTQTTYIENKTKHSGWILFSKPSQTEVIEQYRSIFLVAFFLLICLFTINYIRNVLFDKIMQPLQTIAEGLKSLREENYGSIIPPIKDAIFSPLIDQINQLSTELEVSHENLQSTIDQSLTELRETLETVEIQNIEIDLARKNAIKANQAKSEFLANTSHEIRTPINGIIGFANLLRKSQVNEKQMEYIDTIEESAKVLLLNINDIIDYSRLEIGKLNLDYKPVHIRQLIEESQSFIAASNTSTILNFPTDICESTPKKLLGDPMRIKQVYNSLLTNAVDLSNTANITTNIDLENRSDNQITIKISIITQASANDQRLKEALKILSHRNPSNDLLASKNQMGLIIAKGLVNRMNGHIGLVTKQDKLTLWFTVLLGQPSTEEKDISTQAKIPINILVVDDNASNRKLVCELLKDMNINTESAESGEKAIALCKKHNFSLILMDIQMPGLDGIETTKEIRKLESGNTRIPITALTAHAVEEEKTLLLKSGMDDFLSKPIGESELRELLSRWTQYSVSHTKNSDEPSIPTTYEIAETERDIAPKIVDIKSCIELAKGKKDLAKDMLDMLLESLDTELDAIKLNWNKRDYLSLHEIVHRIHGGACYCGVPNLLSSSASLDKILKDKHYDNCETQLEKLIADCEELIQWRDEFDLEILFSD